MRILLLGEFSGFFNNLKEGLLALGHEVDLVSSGDGWKNVGNKNSSFFPSKNNSLCGKIESMVMQWKHISLLKGYDVVQIISPNIFGNLRLYNNQLLLKRISKTNSKVFLSVAGDHYYIYEAMKKQKYWIKCNPKKIKNKYYKKNNDYVVNLVDGIIPISYTYAEAYRNHSKLLKTIPLPINVDKINYQPSTLNNNKLTIFHGIIREEAKGTKYIEEAMKKIKKDYPNDVDIIIDGKMPLEKYLTVLQNTNVVVDQALSYGYGMNAIYSMAMGKVVLSGNEPETQREFQLIDIPIINITPSVEDIYNKIEKLVLNKKSAIEVGEKSKLFVEDFHHHMKVAQKYVDTWNSVEVNK